MKSETEKRKNWNLGKTMITTLSEIKAEWLRKQNIKKIKN